ncbi:MAG TPA: CPBP family intramembrane metalloprotease [Thermofilum sp.]|nr:CPBP family intramembrane metalloprotease [Thermofilum sp.]
MSLLGSLMLYIVIAFGLSSLIDLVFATVFTSSSVMYVIWGLLRMYTPAIASLVTLRLEGYSFKEALSFTGVTTGESSKIVKWFLIAPLVPFSALALYVVMSFALGAYTLDPLIDILKQQAPSLDPMTYVLMLPPYSYIAAVTVNTLFALGEEIGWRGFLAKKLENLDFVKKCLTIGFLWGLWHASAILLLGHNYRIHRVEGVLLFTVLTITLTFPMMMIRNIAGNVFPAASFHGGINAIWGFTLLISAFPDNELYDGLGVLGIITWTIVALLLMLIKYKKFVNC